MVKNVTNNTSLCYRENSFTVSDGKYTTPENGEANTPVTTGSGTSPEITQNWQVSGCAGEQVLLNNPVQ